MSEKRAVLYARVSGDDRSKEGRNLKGQIEMGRKYALERGYVIVAELAEDDRGVSGADFDLEKLNQALDMAQNHEFDVLVVREVDRLARNLAKQLVVEQELKAAGIEIDYILDRFDDTPEGILQKNVKAIFAEYERTKIAWRNARGRRSKARSGQVVGCGRTAYGYQVAEVNGRTTLAIHEPEAQIVRLIYQWYTGQDQERAGTRKIAKTLCKMRIPTWGDLNPGKSSKRKARYHWSKASVYRILTNEVYAGVWQYGDIEVQVPAIVERTVWEAAQERRESNIHEAKRQRKYEYLLSGHVRCKCDVAMVGMTIRTGGKPYSYYVCNTKRSPLAHDRPCGAPYFRVDKVDAKVWARIAGWLEEPEQLEKGLAAYRSQQEEINRPLLERLAVIDGLLDDNRIKLERLLELFLDGDFDRELLLERKQNLEQIVRSLEKERAPIAAALEQGTLAVEQAESLKKCAATISRTLAIAEADFATKRYVLELLRAEVTLSVVDGKKEVSVLCVLGKEILRLLDAPISG